MQGHLLCSSEHSSGKSATVCITISSDGKVLVTNHSAVTAASKYIVFPGFADVHVHLREPGFFYKESIATGTASAARGGFTTVLTMPNLDPVPDNPARLRLQTDIISKTALVEVLPYGALTVNERGEELSDIEGLAPLVAAFSDDGKGVQRREIMREAMLRAKAVGKIIAAHCEDESLLVRGGCIHSGEYAAKNGFIGISSESEWRQVERDLELAASTGCAYHVCHVSTKESLHIIRQAKKSGVDVSCETAPHYLLLDENDLRDQGRFKMNPPLRSVLDKEALLEAIFDGTVDMIATDHAPHSAAEKSSGLRNSLFGVVGLETAFPVLYTGLVKKGIISLKCLIELISTNPRKRFGLGEALPITGGSFTVFDLDACYNINPDTFLTKGRSTPFEGMSVNGECVLTVVNGNAVWQKASVEK